MFFENYEKLPNNIKNLFSETANKLLTNSFLAADKKDNREYYYFVINYKDYFVEFFQVINYELVINREIKAIQLFNKTNGSLVKLKKDESIILLILRILYHEKLTQTSYNDLVTISVSDIHEKYDYLDLKKKINKTDLVKIIRTYRRYNLIDYVGEIQNSTTKILIMPTIILAFDTNNINEIYNTILSLNSEGEGSIEKVNKDTLD